MALPAPAEIVAFWRDAGAARWFAKNETFDAEIIRRFEPAHHAAARGEFDRWRETAEGALALLILLDQFPRNIWRGSAHAFATDPLALHHARAALMAGHDLTTDAALRVFFYLPFEHSEALADQDLCLAKCEALDTESGSKWSNWARLHRDIIVRFGRFPHRNACLGRLSTAEELAFLEQGGFSG